MDIINNIKIITIPRYVLVSLWLGVIFLIFFAVFLLLDVKHLEGFGPLKFGGANSAQEAAGQILGVLIPIVLLAVLLSFSKGGVDSIKEKTKQMLCEHLPKEFANIPDSAFPTSRSWVEYSDINSIERLIPSSVSPKAKVFFDYEKDAYYCNYVIKFKPYKTKLNSELIKTAISNVKSRNQTSTELSDIHSALPVRVEANIKKVNIGIFFRRELIINIVAQNLHNKCFFNQETLLSNPQLRDLIDESRNSDESLSHNNHLFIKNKLEALDASLLGKIVALMFGHSTQATDLKKESQSQIEVSEEIRYRVNPTATSARMRLPCASEKAGRMDGLSNHDEFICVVYSAIMKPDFLWDSSEILYFSQDLMFMLRAFINEQPDLFISKDLEAELLATASNHTSPFTCASSPTYL